MGVLYGYGSEDELNGAGAHVLCQSVASMIDSIDGYGRKIAASS